MTDEKKNLHKRMTLEEQHELDRPIIARTIGEAHEKTVERIFKYWQEAGNDIRTQDNELTMEWPFPLTIHVTHPSLEPLRSECYKFGEKSSNEYKEQLLTIRPLRDDPTLPDFNYMYSQLYMRHPIWSAFSCSSDHYRSDNWNPADGIDQIEGMCQRIAEAITTRRAVATGWVPQWFAFPLEPGAVDGFGKPLKDDPPCLDMLQMLVREDNDGLLYGNLVGIFRSNDMLTAWGANAYALTYLLLLMINRINSILSAHKKIPPQGQIRAGYLRTTSNSAHIYYVRDKSDLPFFRQKGNY